MCVYLTMCFPEQTVFLKMIMHSKISFETLITFIVQCILVLEKSIWCASETHMMFLKDC